MYVLGILTYWAAASIFGGSGDYITATTYVSEGVSSQSVRRRARTRDNGADLPITVVDGGSASGLKLLEAARVGDIHSVRRLIARNADVNSEDAKGRTPLMLAAAAGEPGIVAMLIDASADTDARDNSGRTALMYAAIKGDRETVTRLIELDANVSLKTSEGTTAQDLALKYNHDKIARVIADEIDRQSNERMMVTRTQFLLAKLGYRPGGIDGYLGPRTREAILRFQKDLELERDGRVTETLLVALSARQRGVEADRKARRGTSYAGRGSASRRALRNASAVRPATGPKDERSGGGFFSRAGKWLERNANDSNDASDVQAD